MNRKFVITLGRELGPVWTISDNNGNMHHVTFNMDIYNPRITHGWCDIRKFYDIKPPRVCYLRHTGNSVFEIHLYDQCSETTLQKFQSHVLSNLPLTTSKLIHFEFRLSKNNWKSSSLVIFLTFFFVICLPLILFVSNIRFNLYIIFICNNIFLVSAGFEFRPV